MFACLLLAWLLPGCYTASKPRTGRILGYVAKNTVHPQQPGYCGFQASNLPNETPRPPYQWSFGGAGGQLGPRTVVANSGATKVPSAKKIVFSKTVRKPVGMLKQAFLAHFEPMVTHIVPWKIP